MRVTFQYRRPHRFGRHAICDNLRIMKTLTLSLLLLASSAAYAQQNPSSTPVSVVPGPVLQAATDDATSSRLEVEIGAVRLTTPRARYTLAYLPFLAPLPGTAFRSSMEMPNALALTGTTIPHRPRTRTFAIVDRR